MRVVIAFGAYNARRYGKPWIAKVTAWPVGKAASLEFGATTGLEAEIEADAGAVVRWGQKDYRGGNGTTKDWGIVLADGSVMTSTAERCRDHWLAGCPVLADEVAA